MKVPLLLIFLLSLRICTEGASGISANTNKTLDIPRYLHLHGTIGNSAITMNLTITGKLPDDVIYFGKGTYYYDNYKIPIDIEGRYLGNGKFEISAYLDAAHQEYFKGHFDGNTFSGIWTTYGLNEINPRKTFPFSLLLDSCDIIPFTAITFRDSVCGYKFQNKCHVIGYYDCDLLVPSQDFDKNTTSVFCKIYNNKSASIETLKGNLKKDANSYFEGCKMEFTDFTKGVPKNDWHFINFQHKFNSSVIIDYNSDDILALTYLMDDNEGGLHCCLEMECYSYSIKEHRLIHLNDIFHNDYSLILKTAITKHMKMMAWGGEYFTNIDIQNLNIPDLYYFTPTGITFVFKELISGYTWVPIFIPFTELGTTIKKQSWME